MANDFTWKIENIWWLERYLTFVLVLVLVDYFYRLLVNQELLIM